MLVTLLSDFGTRDYFVGAMKGALLAVNPQATVVDLTHRFLGPMRERKRGTIINVASTASFQGVPYMATYAATKAFVNSFSEALHAELSGTGVSCTLLTPGPVKTEFSERAGIGDVEASSPGFAWETPQDVARAAGVSRQAVYLHFGSRAGLLVAMARHHDRTSGFAERAARIGGGPDPAAIFSKLEVTATANQ